MTGHRIGARTWAGADLTAGRGIGEYHTLETFEVADSQNGREANWLRARSVLFCIALAAKLTRAGSP